MEKENIEVITFVLDTGLSMESFELAEFFIHLILDRKHREGSRDNIWVLQCDATGTVKKATTAGIFGVEILHPLQSMETSSASGNCIKAVMNAMDYFDKEIQKENKMFASKKLLLLTQLTDFRWKYSDDQIDAVVARIKKSETKLAVIDLTTQKQHAEQDVLSKMLQDVNGLFYSFSEVKTEDSFKFVYDRIWMSHFKVEKSEVGPSSGLDDIINFILGIEEDKSKQEKHGEGSMPKDEVQAVEEQNVEQSMDEDKDKEPVPDEVAPDGGAEAEATPPIEGKLHRNVLNRCLPALVRNIDFQMVSMYMSQNKVIDEVHHLSEKKTESDKIRELIARIQEKDKDTYEEFKECLVKARQSYLKDMLEEHEKIETHRCTVNLSDTKDRSATKIEESDERADKKGHVMISYSLDQKEKSLWIKTQLENNGYTVWIDEENMHDSIADAMERAHVVLLCMSETYNSSVNCQKVALYRNGKRKVIIPLKMEDFTPHGFLESLVMDNIYYNFCGKSPSEDEMKKLLQELASYYIKDLEEPKIVPFDSTIVLDDRVPVPSATPPIQVETSVLSEIIMSLRIDNQDVKMTIKELEEVLAAGPDDAKAPRIVDSILEQGDEKLKTLVLKHLAKLLKTEMASVEEHTNFMIWPATKLSQGETIFVCLHKDKLKTKLKSFFNIAIFYKNIDSPSPLIDLKNPEDLKWTVPAEEDALLIQSVIEEHGDRLYSVHSNLQVICGGPFLLHERQQLVEKKTTIILYCNAKGYKPYGEKEFPSFLAYAGKDIQVDVREGNFALATGNEEWHETLCMGISIGIEDDVNFSGTLGPIVNFENWYGFITCAHVVGTNETRVVQPADGNLGGTKTKEEKICGSVEKWVFNSAGLDRRNGLVKVVGVDAALVKLNKTRPVTLPPKFPPIPREELSKIEGVDPERELQYTGDIEVSEESQRFIGKTVIKYGKTSGFRRGHVDLEGAMVKIPVHQYGVLYKMWNNETFLMRGVYVINRIGPKQFAEEGDSGAGIFLIENDKLTLIGLVIGVLNATYDHRCLATPIEYVLRTLNVKKDQLQVVEKDSHK